MKKYSALDKRILADEIAKYQMENTKCTVRAICEAVGISARTYYKVINTDYYKRRLREVIEGSMLNFEKTAIDTLFNIMKNPRSNDSNKVKACNSILNHTVSLRKMAGVETLIENDKLTAEDILSKYGL
ncbi:hypothetical protein Z969_10420 [Clostridium novyi A str. 4570]|uniref:Homeodomain phBC6A51-type domain-containing protein n=1 Tax=Clostridium novyi A str. 4570 TaxID=1444290 RepID=A0AA88ZMW5_CLONO|nr:phBC6A51 family helix-turn-helix protein [Clostridium novyi]KGM99780.1 hypothetical protein Z969_10420 [Clostridium novyi A str. 4570]